ncbi:MAG: DUF3108 domain-containing protein [Rhizobacter sp.]|nr:DUF3108 domain-containing protein [Rhizobacter sp.]
MPRPTKQPQAAADIPSTGGRSAEVASPTNSSPEDGEPDATPADGSLLYSISGRFAGQQLGGSAKLEWKIGDSSYTLVLHATGSHRHAALFSWRLQAQGAIDAQGPHPHTYEQETRLAGQGAIRKAMKLADDEPGSQVDPNETAREFDPLSAVLQLTNILRTRVTTSLAEPIRPTVSVRLADSSVQPLMFDRQDDETVETPFGPLLAEKYVTRNRQLVDDAPVVTVWMAPELRYTPVRVRIEHQDLAALNFDLASEPTRFPALH